MPRDVPDELGPPRIVALASLQRGLRYCGEGVQVFGGCRIFPPDRVSLGDFTQVDEGVWLLAGAGRIEVGRHVHFAFGSSVSGGGECEVGDFAGFGAGVRLITGTDLTDGAGLTNPTIPLNYRSLRRGQVRVGAHAVVFTGAIVLPDVEIGDGAVVGAGCVVHRNLKPWGIYAGTPLTQVGVRPAAKVLELAKQLTKTKTIDGKQ